MLTQAKRNFSAEGEAPLLEPTFIGQYAPKSLFYPLVLPLAGVWAYYTTVNMSYPVFYPQEAIILHQEYKAGLRNPDLSPAGRSLDKY